MRQATSKAVAGSSANRRQVLSLAAGIALLAGVTTAHAQSTGIVPCDDFLTKYDACVEGLAHGAWLHVLIGVRR